MPTLTRLMKATFSIGILVLSVFTSSTDSAQAAPAQVGESIEARAPAYELYATGSPSLRDIWVDPVNGNDANDGASPAAAFRTISAAWNDVPMNVVLSEGVRINLQPGSYPESSIPVYLESRYGAYAAPVWIRGNGARGQIVLLGDLNIYDTRYLYIESLTINVNGDVLHCELCDHLLLRNVDFRGNGDAHETVKVNQSQYLYIENSDLSGSYENVIDFVSVQYGHIVKNKIHDGDDWCAYVKGGSAYIRVEGNVIYNCGTGGFTAGQGTGFEYMSSPWLHYETYDVKFVNNVIHDVDGACFGVNGGYNALMAYNTCYRVGSRSHVIE
ncbi:MAG TPA: right-handed parallel beta-helix repeat-containing protein, partial [Anaerolineales bacterium]|nr:right-handed parallel beta-helix repeat-containing protein [Anaerolineales bacterium]